MAAVALPVAEVAAAEVAVGDAFEGCSIYCVYRNHPFWLRVCDGSERSAGGREYFVISDAYVTMTIFDGRTVYQVTE